MRFLHVADIHLGKRMNDISLLEDQIYVLEQIVEIARGRAVDAVLIAGDVYQKSSPESSAMAVFNDFVSELVGCGIKVFAISGNHDSDRHISYFSSLIRPSGVYVSERFDGRVQTVTLFDEFGEIDIHLFPFVKPVNVRRCFPDEEIKTYQDMTEVVLRRSELDKSRRCVMLAHQYVTGAELSGSEELAVGGLDRIDARLFAGFDYVALGHIHKPQKAGSETVRYAGSPLKYSFSEVAHKKSVVIAEVREKGDVSVELVPLRAVRDVREVRGTLDEVMSMAYSEDYVRVTICDELVPPDARVTVSTVFPNMMKFAVANSMSEGEIDVLPNDDVRGRSVSELFRDFFKVQNNGAEPNQEHLKLLEEVLQELEEKANEAD